MMTPTPHEHPVWWHYWSFMAVQSVSGAIILWQGLPFYRRLLLGESAGAQYSTTVWALVVVALFHSVFWKARRLPPVVGRAPHPFLGYFVLFLGRLAFVYVAGLFAVVFYVRHADVRFALGHEALLLAVLFTMFCFTTELERLGKALLEPADRREDPPRSATSNQ